MADLRIVDAPVLLQESITDDVKMPTGGLGNFSVRLGDILWYVITKEQLANKSYVDLSSKGVKDSLDEHIADKNNPHRVTKEQVGLGSVDNTADIDKPVSNAVSSAIITATNDMATKAYVNSKDNLKADITYVDSKDGDLTKLTTTDKTNLVKAINEVVGVKANKATTLVGYGITDAYTKSEIDTNYGGVKTLYDKNVAAGAGTNGWNDLLVQTSNGETQRAKNQRNTSIYDFFTKAELDAYKAAPTTYDASKQVQAFFDYIVANDVGVANAGGTFKTSKTINFVGNSKTTQLIGMLNIKPLSNFTGTSVIYISAGEFGWHGGINCFTSDYIYANRKADIGVLIGAYSPAMASRCYIDEIISGGYRQIGVMFQSATTGMTVRKLTVHANGSGKLSDTRYNAPPVTLSNRFDDDNAGTGQYTEFTVSNLPPDNLQTPLHILISNEIFTVSSVDGTTNKIRVVPNVDYTLIGDITANYVWGAGVYTVGGDTSVLNIDNIWATANSFSLWQAALYPANIGAIISEVNLATLVLGAGVSSASVGGTINYVYTESNTFDLVITTRFVPNFRFLNDVTFNLNKLQLLGRLRSSKKYGNYYHNYNTPYGIIGTSNGQPFQAQSYQHNDQNWPIDLTSLDTSPRYQMWGDYSPLTIPLTISSEDRANKLNYCRQQMFIGGSRTHDMSATNTLTFTAPSGCTFQDGSTSYVSNGLNGMTQFVFVANVGNKNF